MPFEIDLTQTFPHLPRAPIVEAVIHWRARAEATLDPEQLRQALTERLPEYPEVRPQHEVQIAAQGTASESQVAQRTRWQGFRLHRDDEPYVVQFTTDGLVVSRMSPYNCWASFEDEALRLWDVFVTLAAPAAVQRLGVRFINRIELSGDEQPAKYLRVVTTTLQEIDLPIQTFVYREVYAVPKTSYRIHLMRAIQTPESDGDTRALILDIDVSAEELGWLEREPLANRLAEMRWLKNKVFFSCITEQAKQAFQKEAP